MTKPMHDTIVKTFERLAQLTWERLYHGHRLSCTQSEETITDINLLDLSMLDTKEVRVYKGTKPEEAAYGFDWEWWIGSPTTGWWRYAVQAKRLKLPEQRYLSLRHAVSLPNVSPNTKEFQINLLENYATQHSAIPLYCFYNCVDHLTDYSKYWHCPLPIDRYQLGCTVAPLHIVRNTHKKGRTKSFERIHENKSVLPWRCLVKCKHIGQNHEDSQPMKQAHLLAPPNWDGGRISQLPAFLQRPPSDEDDDFLPSREPDYYQQVVSNVETMDGRNLFWVLPKKILVIDTGS